MGLISVILLTITLLFLLIGKFLLKDLVKYFINFTKGQFSLFNKKNNNFGQLLASVTISGFIGVLSYLLYKALLMLVAYLLTSDLIEFFIVNRGVFSSSEYAHELQNPLIPKNFIYGAIVTPLAQFVVMFFMINSLKYYMFKINTLFKQSIYKVSSLVFFGVFSCLVFLSFELLAFIQSVTFVTTATLIVLLIGAKLSYLLFYFGIIHIELLKNKSYTDSFKKLNFNKLEEKLISNQLLLIIAVMIIATLLNYPLYSGFQFGRNNWIIGIKLIIVVTFFLVILKAIFAKGFNYIGVFMINENRSQEISSIKFIKPKSKKVARYFLVTVSSGLLFLDFKSFVFFVLNAFIVCLFSFIIITGFYTIGSLYSSVFKKTSLSVELNWNILTKMFSSFLLLVFLPLIIMLSVFSVITIFPKENTNLKNYTNYQKSVIDEKGNLLYFQNNRYNPSIAVSNAQLPPFFIKALLIKEDRKLFHQHNLLPNLTNWHGISLKSLYSGLFFGSSNINQQLLKNLAFKKFPQELQRKISEIGISYSMSKSSTPEEIINHYINVVSFNGGAGHSGVLKASYHTFGRSISSINELEMLYLLFTLHRGATFKLNENKYIPYTEAFFHADEVKQRLLVYASNWYKDKLITKREFKKLKSQKLNFREPILQVFKNKDGAETEKYNLRPYKCGNSIATNTFFLKSINEGKETNLTYVSTIGLDMQSKIEKAVEKFNSKFSSLTTKEDSELYLATLIVDVKTGSIIGHHGGDANVDLTNFGSGRPVASSIKPIVLLELLEQGYKVNLYDGVINGRRTPKNHLKRYSNTYLDEIEILKYSANAPMRNIDKLTNPINLFKDVEKRLQKMGIPADAAINLNDKSLNLHNTINYPIGSRRMTLLSIAQMYQMIFNKGEYIELSAFNEAFNPYDLKTTILKKERALIYEEENISIITNALKRVLEKGGTGYSFSKYLPKDIQFMAKTGTSSNYKDGITVISDGKTLVVSYVSYGKEENGQLKLGRSKIPHKSGGKSAGVLGALIFNELYN